MKILSPRSFFLLSMLLAALVSGGCSKPDHWAAFRYGRLPEEPKEAPASLEIPAALQPRPALSAGFVLPVAGQAADISVEQATLLALRNNRDLHVQQLSPIIAGTFALLERGAFDPELFAELEYAEEKRSEISRSTGTQLMVHSRDSSAVAGIRQTLPSGTTVEATIGQDRAISDRAPEQQSARLGLSITQSLLQGLGPMVNLASVEQAELEASASAFELRGFVEALLAEMEIAYWNFVLAREEIGIFEQSLAVARQQLEEVEQRIGVGILPAIEAAAARAEVARREQALIDGRSKLEETRLRLLRLLSPDPEGGLDLQLNATSEPRLETEPITDLADRLLLAEKSRPDLREARLRLARNRLETIRTRSGLLPRLDLFIALGRSGYADTFSESFRTLSDEGDDFTAGLSLSHFLGNRAAEARDLAARASRAQAAAAVANLRQLVRLDVLLAANEVTRASRQIAASEITRALQEKSLQAEKERFDVGSSTALQVAQAQRDLLAASIAEVEAVVGYRTALVSLYLAEGSLLERRGIRLAAEE